MGAGGHRAGDGLPVARPGGWQGQAGCLENGIEILDLNSTLRKDELVRVAAFRGVDQRWCLETDEPTRQPRSVDQVVVDERGRRERPSRAQRAQALFVLLRLLDDALQRSKAGREGLARRSRAVAPFVVRGVKACYRPANPLGAMPVLPDAAGLNVDDGIGHGFPLTVPGSVERRLNNTR